MGVLQIVNLAVRFALELAMFAAFIYWGFATAGSVASRIGLGLCAPLLAIAAWGMFVAPRARWHLSDPGRLFVEIAIFGLAVLALVAAGRKEWAIALTVVTGINIALLVVLDQR